MPNAAGPPRLARRLRDSVLVVVPCEQFGKIRVTRVSGQELYHLAQVPATIFHDLDIDAGHFGRDGVKLVHTHSLPS
jgi:hypothetical protein